MRNSFKILFFYFLLFVNVISASSKNDIISINFSENVYSEKSVVPIINVNSSNINSFSTCFGTASQQQTFIVSGSGLSNDISISVPSGYEISLNGTTWSSTLSLAIDGSGNVSSTTISIRIAANASSGSQNGAVTISSGSENGNFNITGNVYTIPNITGTLNTCVGSSSNLNPSNNVTWTSSNQSVATVNNSGDVTGISPGTTTITCSRNGCTDSVVFTVFGISASITTNSNLSYCQGSPISVVFNSNSGSGLTFQWYRNNNIISGATLSSYTATSAGSYTVEVTDSSSGCSDVSSAIVVSANQLPTVTISSPDNSICQGGNSVLQANTNNNSNYTFAWYNNGVAISGANSPSYTAIQSGTYTVHATNSSGCVGISPNYTFTVNSLPTVDFTFSSSICSGVATQFISNVSGNGNFQYSWNFGNSSSSTSANPTTTFTSFGCGSSTYNVTLTVTDTNGCQKSVTHSVSVNQQPEADFFDPVASTSNFYCSFHGNWHF